MTLNISITSIPVLLGEDIDFFNINQECSIDNCSIIILIFIIIFGTVAAVILFFIIRRFRLRNRRLYVQVRAVKVKNIGKESKNIEKHSECCNLISDVVGFSHDLKQKKRELPLFKILEFGGESIANHNNTLQKLDILTAKSKNPEIYHVPLEKFFNEHLNEEELILKDIKQIKSLLNSESGSSKGSNKNLFHEKLKNKSHIFEDDNSVQYEDESINDEDFLNEKIIIHKKDERDLTSIDEIQQNLNENIESNGPIDKMSNNFKNSNEEFIIEENRLITVDEKSEENFDTS